MEVLWALGEVIACGIACFFMISVAISSSFFQFPHLYVLGFFLERRKMMDNDGRLLFCLVVLAGSDQFCRRTTGEGRSETKLFGCHQTTETEVVFVVTFRVLTFWGASLIQKLPWQRQPKHCQWCLW
jgi:hypothetical protein